MKLITLILALILVLGIVGISGCTNTNSTQSNSSNNSTTPTNNNITTNSGYQVKINYSGEWMGQVETFEGTKTNNEDGSQTVNGASSKFTIEGPGEKTYPIDGTPGEITVVAHKTDTGTGTLTLELLKDGKVIKSGKTSEIDGYVKFTYKT
jgi:hypothetical protein